MAWEKWSTQPYQHVQEIVRAFPMRHGYVKLLCVTKLTDQQINLNIFFIVKCGKEQFVTKSRK